MAAKINGELSDWARAPPSGSKWQRFLRSIYDPEEKSFLGRTSKRWGIVLVFYLVFYAVLALLFGLCMGGLFFSLDQTRPKYTLHQSLIGSNPGVAFRPRPLETTGTKGVGLRYNNDNSSSYDPIIQQLDKFFEPYKSQDWFLKQSECAANYSMGFGYPNTPCFFVKVNKVFDWEPEFYEDATALPADMPKDLVDHITVQDALERKRIWISCVEEGSNKTKIEYPWGRGLLGTFYPYTNVPGYKSPVLAVKLTPPTNTLVFVRCRAWAKNIIYSKSIKEPSGYTRIQIYIEDNTSGDSDTTE